MAQLLNEDYIPIAALNQYAYCPHRCWRMFCAGEYTDNAYTIEGTALHERVHTLSSNQREETWQVRAVWLKSDRYRLIGKSDLIEEANGQLYPVEYKRGKRGEWDNDELQVCAQALCLEEMTGQTIHQGYLYYAHSHQRQLVEMNADLRRTTLDTLQAVSALIETGTMPPAIYTPRCKGCSLYQQCLPQAVDKVSRYREA
ncbi:CRISPR-associated protein Cas4 [Leptolyngbya sp. FACHB-261]|uniref:CRISPR-associated protein Cas4 n=1 Tax=Leptolyngbya sp. FACHB-261 TaxID=2692806 RepID=UPI00168913B9|nr:CRISPR-associated protein Cas4 [Leptolyngbya sp. FACHB-261]MBD2102387.1 CRISPR-associated protein Cas4 [Leptolyngbya sp. FACHB-261]